MTQQPHDSALAGPGWMLLSAAIFGYFGFGSTWLTTGINGEFLVYVAILEWTLKVSAIAFLLCAIVTFIKPMAGNVLFSIVGLLGALAFGIVLVLDLMDPQHMAVHPVLLFIFAAWNGYSSWVSLQGLLGSRGSTE